MLLYVRRDLQLGTGAHDANLVLMWTREERYKE